MTKKASFQEVACWRRKTSKNGDGEGGAVAEVGNSGTPVERVERVALTAGSLQRSRTEKTERPDRRTTEVLAVACRNSFDAEACFEYGDMGSEELEEPEVLEVLEEERWDTQA